MLNRKAYHVLLRVRTTGLRTTGLRTTGFIVAMLAFPVLAERSDPGLPCEVYVGHYRSIEIGHPVSYAIQLLENNSYRCKEFKGMAKEIVTCDLKLDEEFSSEVSLVVENGKIADIETRTGGIGCLWTEIE